MFPAGGEKRRLGIAWALVAKPSLLFLDEPTTGLDAFAALNIMDHMACLTALGHTIVASIHQPRAAIWDMLHRVGACPELLSSLANLPLPWMECP
jgi:ATP-binding cassette subfamily G (WHITE) protein 2